MEDYFLSFIVPAYNTSNYISECIASLEEQDCSDYEIIIIDDGSTDNTQEICKKYCQKYNNIKLICQANKGGSRARNVGIQKAKGKYIWFVDSDDKIEKNILNKIKKNSDTDFIVLGYYRMYKNKLKDSCFDGKDISLANLEDSLILDNRVGGYIWNKIYKKQILIENDIKFDEEKTYCEDLDFNKKYIKLCKSVLYFCKPCYYYRQRRKSATGKLIKRDLISMNNTYEEVFDSSYNVEVKKSIAYKYYFNTIKLRKMSNSIQEKKFNVRNDIVKIGKTKKRNFKEKIKELGIKYFYHIFLLSKKMKDVIFLFD